MALEIRELIIKVQVSEENGRNRQGAMNEQQLQALKREIMEECMDKLKQELEKKKDR
jgi:hypothetical protein